ncbi:hypothetical protein MM239_13105 [Belliella sp. DSM 111904]|uniref:Two component regulator propeller n=1 Tax=Belliella filtrata TaxID=2923435 RepID=A0ABS9V1P2_9BACT|nr:hypothetical protein [Belliella filtrata]MCH7410339.1 hypothetical protein [Belliella filtrata]
MIKRILVFFIFLGAHLSTIAQEIQWDDPVKISIDRITRVSIDNQDNIFVATADGDVYQYAAHGAFINNFSPVRQGKIDFIEAAWTVNIFTFSIDMQEYRLFDRFLNPLSEIALQTKGINLAKAATIGNGNIIWIYDESDFSLKQFDHRRNQITQQQPLNLILSNSELNVLEIKEYQNMVFVNIKNEGISILDNQANLIKTIPKPFNAINFDKENLIDIRNDSIVYHNFINDKTTSFNLPENISNHKIISGKKNLICYNSDEVLFFQKPTLPINR